MRFAIDTPPKRRDTQLTHKRRIPTNSPLIGEPRYNSEFTFNCSKPPYDLTASEFGCRHDLTASEFISLVGTSSHHRCGYSNIFQKKYPLNSGEIHRRCHYSVFEKPVFFTKDPNCPKIILPNLRAFWGHYLGFQSI